MGIAGAAPPLPAELRPRLASLRLTYGTDAEAAPTSSSSRRRRPTRAPPPKPHGRRPARACRRGIVPAAVIVVSEVQRDRGRATVGGRRGCSFGGGARVGRRRRELEEQQRGRGGRAPPPASLLLLFVVVVVMVLLGDGFLELEPRGFRRRWLVARSSMVASPPADNKKPCEQVARIAHEYFSSKSMNCRPETVQNNQGEEAVVFEVERKYGRRRPLLPHI
jgi:hypothetical protein